MAFAGQIIGFTVCGGANDHRTPCASGRNCRCANARRHRSRRASTTYAELIWQKPKRGIVTSRCRPLEASKGQISLEMLVLRMRTRDAVHATRINAKYSLLINVFLITNRNQEATFFLALNIWLAQSSALAYYSSRRRPNLRGYSNVVSSCQAINAWQDLPSCIERLVALAEKLVASATLK